MNLRRLDLNLLIVFDAVYAERSVTRAGERIGLSQPAVSNALTRLRAVVGDDLFTRGPKGLVPSRRARAMAGPVQTILADLRMVLDDAPFAPDQAQDIISIAMVDFFETLMLPPLMQFLTQNAPGIRLRLVPSSGRSYEMLQTGEVDLAIASYTSPPDSFGLQTLMHADYACVMRHNHPRSKGPMTVERFSALQHILLSPNGDMHGFVDDALSKLGLSRKVSLTITSFQSAVKILTETDMVMTAPIPVVDMLTKSSELCSLPCPVETPENYKRLDVIWHKQRFNHPLGNWFRDVLTQIAADVSEMHL
jgi:DNA-binding transcriptional LysR family regulator